MILSRSIVSATPLPRCCHFTSERGIEWRSGRFGQSWQSVWDGRQELERAEPATPAGFASILKIGLPKACDPMTTGELTQRDFITIVSGLPRSGTSMMMKMLDAGGIPAITDNLRVADEDNPNGYYEFEAVKKSKQDASWVEGAAGKAVKMVYRLLYDLPPQRKYRVLFMRRNLDEVLASQTVMLERHGQTAPGVDDAKMRQIFVDQLQKVEAWLAGNPDFAVLDVDYNEIQRNPAPQVAAINQFLGGGLNTAAMQQVVDPALYRNRR
jgi:hypothetical protein